MSGETQVHEGDLLWRPTPERIEAAQVTRFIRWLARERGLAFENYGALWDWSVTEIEAFWQAIWDYFEVKSSAPHTAVLESRRMPGAKWFPGARLNYAEHILRMASPDRPALIHGGEDRPLAELAWAPFAGQVRAVAQALREMGVRPGDRVAAYVTNRPEAMIAMLGAVAIGAVWSSCSPDFGSKGVLDRLQQLAPKVLFATDGYRYGGKVFDRRAEVAQIAGGIASLEHLVHIPFQAPLEGLAVSVTAWAELIGRPAVPEAGFRFEQVAFDHPIWILFSSGTTGLPKAIVHGHGGMILENLKALAFHFDFHVGDRAFFFTTTGWMMWNFLTSMMLAGSSPILYDGNPAWPTADRLWQVAAEAKAQFFGASPAFVDIMMKAGVRPGETYDLTHLKAVVPAGAPVSPKHTAWFYEAVKRDLWVATGSGGTDVCTGFMGGVVTLPVRAGEMQARCLGVAARALDDEGRELIDEVGELTITEPMPSMPVAFWNDPDGAAYRATYFETYPGLWRHGDFFRVNARGGCFVYGRSDATLNRGGIRIGTAEIYASVEALAFVEKALVVHVELADGRSIMPLFVKPAAGHTLGEAQKAEIALKLRREFTPRHVPDEIVEAPDIPMTLTGKKLEVPVRRILAGAPPEKAVNANAVANPQALAFFEAYGRRWVSAQQAASPIAPASS